MDFEFDPRKSKSNIGKHGIDFVSAQAMWEDVDRLVLPARIEDEPRKMIIAKVKDKFWSAVFTIRGENIRIISVRRARKEEKELYES